MTERALYFDHNATTPVDERVFERFLTVERDAPANPGSLHGAGRRARGALEDARGRAAEALGVARDEVVFVGGGTEANNIAVRGLGDAERPVLLAPVEHPSVLEPANLRGTVLWSVDPTGQARVEAPDRPVGLVCLVHGQNEIGTLQPVEAAGRLARELGVPFHVDAAQTLGRVPLEAVTAMASTITLSAHKVGGLRGAGVLIVRQGVDLRPLVHGGGQELGLRPGTPSPALAAATALAIELAVREQDQRGVAMRNARAEFVRIFDELDGVTKLTPLDHSLPNTVMLAFDGVDGRNLLPALDLSGVQASHGSACSSGSPLPPRVLAAIGCDEDFAGRAIRFSFAPTTSIDDVRDGAQRVLAVVRQLRDVAHT